MSGYKTTCPSCGGNNFYVTPHNGVGYCFNGACSYWERDGNSNAEPKKKVRSEYLLDIRQFYAQIAEYYHSNLSQQHLDFLYKRGYTDALINQRKIGFAPKGKHPLYKSNIAKEAGLATAKNEAFMENRITFPYLSGGVVSDLRGRALDNDSRKYLSPFNDAYYRGADYAYNHDCLQADVIVLTEGEIKADISTLTKYPAIALPGMKSWRREIKQRKGQKFVFLFDNQATGYKDVYAAISKHAVHLDNPYVATLPLLGHDKMDIDTFILMYGADAYTSVVESALSYGEWYNLIRDRF